MKCLFLTDGIHDCADYSLDSIYIGLKRLGHTVEDRPRKRSLHSNKATYRFGTEVCGDFGTSIVDKPDLTFVGTRYKGQLPELFMAYDGRDRGLIDDRLYKSAFLYFKREFREEYKSLPKARPLQLGLVKKRDSFGIPSSKRDIDVSFTLYHHKKASVRRKVFDFFKNIKGIKTFSGFQSFSEYQKILDMSKISISLRGAGWDTYRYWEIVHHGAILCSEQLPLVIPNNFENDAIFFDSANLNDLEEKLRYYLSDPELLDKMQTEAWERLLKFHTAKARATYVLQEVNKYYETL